MKRNFLSSLFILIAIVAYGQGNMNLPSNYGGNNGENEFFREADFQEYYTKFDKFELNTKAPARMADMTVNIKDGTVIGYTKNFKNDEATPEPVETFETTLSDNLYSQSHANAGGNGYLKYKGFGEGSKLNFNPRLDELEFTYQLKKGKISKISFRVKVYWEVKDETGLVLHNGSYGGYFLRLSYNKKKDKPIGLHDAFALALVESLDKLMIDEKFKKSILQ